MDNIKIKTKYGHIEVGDNLPVNLIAEIGLNHNGSIELAKEHIKQAAFSGACFVKLQKRTLSSLAIDDFLDAPFTKCPSLGSTQREVREKLELNKAEYVELKEFAESYGLTFFSSAFDIESLNFLLDIGVDLIKVASHSLTNGKLLKEIKQQKLTTLMSLGGSTREEQDIAVSILSDSCQLLLFHCVSSYPTSDAACLIDSIPYLKKRYNLPIGFSGHENGTAISLAAAALGASLIERHFTINKSMIGLDHGISLEPHEFASLSSDLKRLHTSRGIKESLHEHELAARLPYHVAIRASKNLKKNKVLNESDIVLLQPLLDGEKFFTGLEIDKLMGEKLKRDINKHEAISRKDIS